MFTIWIMCALGEVLSIKNFMRAFDNYRIAGFSLILIVALLLIIINPLKYLYREFRFEFLYSLYQNIIAPFGYVRFKDFFLGDILTSAVKPLIDFYFIGCFFSTDSWKNPQIGDICKADNKTILLITLIPYWIRFWQCINRFYFTKQWFPHLVNAGKYLSTIIVIFITYFKNEF